MPPPVPPRRSPGGCTHEPLLPLRSIFTMSLFFTCRHCGHEIEPAPAWRRARGILNLLTLALLLIIAFLPLEASMWVFARNLLLVGLVVALFWTLSIRLLKRANYGLARPEVVEAAREALDLPEAGVTEETEEPPAD
ncbi:MAG: hypothetical protein QM270_04820 [Bacillota bacterium]|nr:hypothetical protein [Bacillota bacterium]